MSSNEAIKRIPQAVGGVVQKLEKAAVDAVDAIEKKGDETLEKVNRAVTAVTEPLRAADELLDDIIGGHNGAPVDEGDANGEDTFPGVPADTEAPSADENASTLGERVPVPDHVKQR